jgi:hypothetical protein
MTSKDVFLAPAPFWRAATRSERARALRALAMERYFVWSFSLGFDLVAHGEVGAGVAGLGGCEVFTELGACTQHLVAELTATWRLQTRGWAGRAGVEDGAGAARGAVHQAAGQRVCKGPCVRWRFRRGGRGPLTRGSGGGHRGCAAR